MTPEENNSISKDAFSKEIEPFRSPEFAKLTEEIINLLSQSKRVFLLGAGCGKCAGLPLMNELTQKVLDNIPSNQKTHVILQELVEQYKNGKGCTIEDYMSELVDLISIATRRNSRNTATATIPLGKQSYPVEELNRALVEIKQKISKIIMQSQIKSHHHRQFIRAVHGTLQSGKSGTVQPVDYFTLNYDTLLEDVLSLERIPISDGFDGGATGWWNSNAYTNPSAHARVFKVHGSIDWCLLDDDVLPRRVRQGLLEGEPKEPVLIWPAATKYREAQKDPYAQIINIMQKTLHPSHPNEAVLAVVGYSFGDLHINYEIDRAFRESEGRLTILVFISTNEPEGILKEWFEDTVLSEHICIYANRGYFHDKKIIEAKTDLPWWKFEVLTRLLGGER